MVPRVEPAIQGPPAIRGRETFVDMYSSTQNHGSVENKSSNIYFLWKMSGNFPLPWLWEKGNSKLWNSNSTGFMILDDLILGFCDVFAVQSWLAIKLSLEVLGFASGGCVFQDMRGAVVYTTVIFQQSNIAIKIQWPVYMLYIPLAIPTLKWGSRDPKSYQFYTDQEQSCSKMVGHISQEYELTKKQTNKKGVFHSVSILARTTVRQKCSLVGLELEVATSS